LPSTEGPSEETFRPEVKASKKVFRAGGGKNRFSEYGGKGVKGFDRGREKALQPSCSTEEGNGIVTPNHLVL